METWRTGAIQCRSAPSMRDYLVCRTNWFVLLCALLLLTSCDSQRPRSSKSFDDLRETVKGKSAGEIEKILGQPDLREKMVLFGERWVWWNYTYLDGNKYPPNDRGRLVHLEIIFTPPGQVSPGSRQASSDLRPMDTLSITYILAKSSAEFSH